MKRIILAACLLWSASALGQGISPSGGGGAPTGTAGGSLGGTYPNPTVVTNANLTGPITSVGNATSIASQTGTGTKFVVDTSPALVTPALGVATATSIAVGGCTVGSDGFCVTGTSTFNNNIALGSAVSLAWNADAFFLRDAANTLAQRNGTTAQTINVYATFTDASNYRRWSIQNQTIAWEAAGTGANSSGVNIYNRLNGSITFGTNNNAQWNIGTGGHWTAINDNSQDIGASGATRPRSIFLGTNATVGGAVINTGITSDATHTDASVCEDTTTHQFYSGSGTLGVCLGTSSLRFKHDVTPLVAGLDQVMALRPIAYKLNADHGDPDHLLYGFSAEHDGSVLPDLMGRDTHGRPNTFDYLGVVPVLVRAIQEQQAEIAALRARLQ